jgi:hypothetical protein
MEGMVMSRQIVIQLTKCVLVLDEQELFKGLRPEVLQAALARGKGYRRSLSVEKRQTEAIPKV